MTNKNHSYHITLKKILYLINFTSNMAQLKKKHNLI